MSGSTARIPPFKALAAALRRTTEHLARELAQPTASAPDWSETEWAIAQSAAAMQGISVLLAGKLAWPGPPAWRMFLAEQHEQSVLRDERIGALLGRIDATLRGKGVGCVALKGAALRALGLYARGERPMGDVDLLVADWDLPSIAMAMADIGYVEAFTMQRHRVFEPWDRRTPRGFGEHVDNALKIEIHTAVAEPLPVSKVEITARLWLDRPEPGINAYPSLAALLLHLLLHAAGNIRAHTLRHVHLHDIAAMAPLLAEDDWRAVLERPRGGERAWWVFPPLVLAARYHPERIPEDVLRAARAVCPRVLRVAAERQSLTDVSWSNLRIHAFPGIAWSRTPFEALRFMRSRALPSRRSLAELECVARDQPQLDRVPWYGLPHGRRVLHWLFSKPPRVQTMVSVRAALESAGIGVKKADS